MYIHEAVKKAIEQSCLIIRTDSDYVGIEPTESSDCCIVHDLINKKSAGPRWNPNAGDLMSDKWELHER